MAVTTTKTNKPLNPRGNDQSPKGYNRAELYTGKALDFDGVNDVMNLGKPSVLNINDGAITLACYARIDATTGNHHLFRQENNASKRILFAYQHSSTSITLGDYANGTYSELDATLTDAQRIQLLNEIVFIVATHDTNGDRKVYFNGQLIGSDNRTSGLVATNDQNAYIGANASSEWWNGLIANFKIFNTALTAAQVADLYNNPEKIVPTGVSNDALKLWLPMQEGAGTTAYDGSGNGNHGTISGATWQHGIGAPVSQTAVIDWNKGTNKVKYSEDFSNSDWTKQSGVTRVQVDKPHPMEANTAFKVVEMGATVFICIAVTRGTTRSIVF